jgi:hypothetical protein
MSNLDIQCLACSPKTGARCVQPSKHTISGEYHGAAPDDQWSVPHWHYGSQQFEGTMADVAKMLNEQYPWWDVIACVPDAQMKTGMEFAPAYFRWSVLYRTVIT